MLQWRRDNVFMLLSKGYSQIDIARKLQVSKQLVHLDVNYWRKEAKEAISNSLTERLPLELSKSLQLVTDIKLQAIQLAEEASKDKDRRLQLMALELARDCALTCVDLTCHDNIMVKAMEIADDAKRRLDDVKAVGQNSSSETERTAATDSEATAVF